MIHYNKDTFLLSLARLVRPIPNRTSHTTKNILGIKWNTTDDLFVLMLGTSLFMIELVQNLSTEAFLALFRI